VLIGEFLEAQIREEAEKVKEHGEGVLALSDPGDGNDTDRVDREDEGGQPGSGES
jgi:hypothetical protein